MKKISIIFGAVLIVSLFAAFLSSWGVPTASEESNPVAVAENGSVYFADNNLFFSTIYGLDSNGKAFFFYREFNGYGNSSITQLAADGTSLYFLRETPQKTGTSCLWEPVRLDADGTAEILGGAVISGWTSSSMTAPSYVAASDSSGSISVSAIDAADGSFLLSKDNFSTFLPLYASYSAKDGCLLVMDAQGIWSQITGSEVIQNSRHMELPSLPSHITIPVNIRLACKAPFLGVTAVAVSVVFWLLVVLYRLIRYSRKLAVRTSAATGLCLLFSLAIIVGGISQIFWKAQLDQQAAAAEQTVHQNAQAISAEGASEIMDDTFYTGQLYPLYSKLLCASQAELLSVKNDRFEVRLSFHHTIGSDISAISPNITQTLQQAVSRKSAVSSVLSTPNGSVVVAAAPLLSNGIVTGVILLKENTQQTLLESAQTLLLFAGIGLLLAFVLSGFIAFLLWRMMLPLGRLSRQMDEVSEGRLKMERITPSHDELGQMAKSMQEMCMGLSIRDYEMNSTLKSYGRFIPRDLPELLDRASVMEVSFGDVRSITGNIAVLAVVNRDRARALLEDAPFVDFVNQCFAAANHSVMQHGGYILSSGFEMGAFRVYFPGGAQNCLNSALDLLGGAKENHSLSGPTPHFLMILHHATFLYGVAGSDEQAFPFLSSNELEFLASYSHHFADAGCKIVFTHEFLPSIPENFHYRYIGYVTDPATSECYKLYELLDSYPELERNLRLWYDKDFQQAIQMFYRSDFYLARTTFSNILRSCPGDGVAKWYLFACEYYFQSGKDADFQLFSIDP